MKKLTYLLHVIFNVILVAVTATLFCSCGTHHQMLSGKANAAVLHDTLLMDRDGNRYTLKIMPDHKLWMTTNLKLNIPGSYCYENSQENCERYGRLYSWESAQKGCSLLGEGWRVPAKEEWRQLTVLHGDITKDSTAMRKEAFKALLNTGNSGFNAVLGGGRAPDGEYARLDAHGFYWTVTEIDSSTAWFYNFAKGSQALYQQDAGEKPGGFSVRCVKGTDSPK